MLNRIIWGIFFLITLAILIRILFIGNFRPAGDIVEYYGMTVSLLSHGNVGLTASDQKAIEKDLPSPYFSDPQYYIKGTDGIRYPVHFLFYSILLIPARLVLPILGLSPLLSFPLTNLLVLTLTLIYIALRFLRRSFERVALIAMIYLSPVIFFITWPGPDLFYICFLLISLFSFFSKEYFLSLFFASLASWQSQPLGFIAVTVLVYNLSLSLKNKYLKPDVYVKSFVVGFLIFLPYFINYLHFRMLTPWILIENGWTRVNGFGLQNITLGKFFEQLFDPNIGIIWYAPLVVILGFYGMSILARKEKGVIFISAIYVVAAFLYHSNPAWNYGSSGFGPSRHAIFLLPLFIYFASKAVLNIKVNLWTIFTTLLLFIWQIYSLSFNGFITPDFRNSLNHSPYARYLLDNYPELYNATPEIFTDRTNHNDPDHPASAVYKDKGICRKAYILEGDIDKLNDVCGYIPKKYIKSLEKLMEINNPYLGIYINY